ncbi:MAG: phospholipid carrier-dependent glycosyltransferase [Streptosporangiales bacterium]|nr:phospholipid carrier-dependent glycosyltransferase [Streptosporangiales bacterium]
MTSRLLAPPPAARTAQATATASWRRWFAPLGVAITALLGGLHVLAVWPTYGVGSFDDDGEYIALARAVAAGKGFVDTSLPGDPIDMNREPGAALFAPLAALSPDSTLQFRLFCLMCFLACFPLAWHWMRLRGLDPATSLTALALLALNPVAATFGSMVMLEMPFLVSLLAMLIAMHHWDRQDRAVTRWGVAAVVLSGGLLALKAAALAFFPGLVGYLLVRRWFRKAALAAVAGLLVIVPVATIRMLHGVSPAGERNSGYLDKYADGPLQVLADLLPQSAAKFVTYAVPNATVPVQHFTYLPAPLPDLLFSLRFVAVALIGVGFVAWHWRHGPDATLVIAPVYLAQSLAYFPFINERRIILMMPLVLLWLVMGALAVGYGVARLWRRLRPRPLIRGYPVATPVSLGMCAILTVPLLAAQFDRNYLLPPGEMHSRPLGSSYVQALQAITDPREDIASSYRWTIAAFTNRDTLNDVQFFPCNPKNPEGKGPEKLALLRQHTYGAVLFGTLNRPWRFDDRCTLRILERNPAWAVRIHRQQRDRAMVYQLIGPGTANPELSDVTVGRPVRSSGATLTAEPEKRLVDTERPGTYHLLTPDGDGNRTILTVPFGRTASVTQVSLGEAGQLSGAAESVAIELRGTDGTWSRVWEVRGADVHPTERGPDVVVRRLSAARPATAMRVVFTGDGPFEVHDLHALAQTGHRGEPALTQATDRATKTPIDSRENRDGRPPGTP